MCAVSNRTKRIIEVIGPAGAGKTTLAKALSQHNGIQLAEFLPNYRRFTNFPFFARNTLASLPIFLKLYFIKEDIWLSKRDAAWMVTLKGWHQVLNHKTFQNSSLIMDEGPIYYMAYLHIYGSEILNSPSAQTWWDQMYKQWSRTMHMVIYLDAPDLTLMERIRAREKAHGVKTMPDSYAFKFLADLRENYEYLLYKLTSEKRSLKILRFNTLKVPLNQVASEVIAAL